MANRNFYFQKQRISGKRESPSDREERREWDPFLRGKTPRVMRRGDRHNNTLKMYSNAPPPQTKGRQIRHEADQTNGSLRKFCHLSAQNEKPHQALSLRHPCRPKLDTVIVIFIGVRGRRIITENMPTAAKQARIVLSPTSIQSRFEIFGV